MSKTHNVSYINATAIAECIKKHSIEDAYITDLMSKGGHICVYNPSKILAGEAFESCLEYEVSFLKPKWNADFKVIARRKALMSYELKMDTALIWKFYPYLIAKGDAKGGGGIFRQGLVLACASNDYESDDQIGRYLAQLLLDQSTNERNLNFKLNQGYNILEMCSKPMPLNNKDEFPF